MCLFKNGGMLTGDEIERQIKKGNIVIDPFDPDRINPNSYNLRLHPQLLIYDRGNTSRCCELPTGSTDPILDYINREKIRLGTSTVNATQKVCKLDEPDGNNTTIKSDDFTTEDNGHSTIKFDDSIITDYITPLSMFDKYVQHEDLDKFKEYDLDFNPIDMRNPNGTIEFNIPETGYVLRPGVLYIGRTIERTFTDKFIPMLDGRSSGGRLGISIHICAGFGDIGFDGTWTLEITVVEPVIIYPNVEIAQVSYFKPYGKTGRKYNGRYNKQIDATASRFWKG